MSSLRLAACLLVILGCDAKRMFKGPPDQLGSERHDEEGSGDSGVSDPTTSEGAADDYGSREPADSRALSDEKRDEPLADSGPYGWSDPALAAADNNAPGDAGSGGDSGRVTGDADATCVDCKLNRISCPTERPFCCDCWENLESIVYFCESTTADREMEDRVCGHTCFNIYGTTCYERLPEGSESDCGSVEPNGVLAPDWRQCPAERPHCCVNSSPFVAACSDHTLYGWMCSSPPGP